MTGAVSRKSLEVLLRSRLSETAGFFKEDFVVDQGVIIVVVFSHVQTGHLHGFYGD